MRTYKPVDKTLFTCVCGCGRSRLGNAGAKHYEPYCRVRDFLKRRKHQKLLTQERLAIPKRVRMIAGHYPGTNKRSV